jgi:hypothetical protein
MVMVIERLLLGGDHRLRRQTFATMAERPAWNVWPRLQPFCITLLDLRPTPSLQHGGKA